MLQHRRRLGRRQIDRLRHEQLLRLERPGQHLLANLLVQNPLVQRVLVDDLDAGVRSRRPGSDCEPAAHSAASQRAGASVDAASRPRLAACARRRGFAERSTPTTSSQCQTTERRHDRADATATVRRNLQRAGVVSSSELNAGADRRALLVPRFACPIAPSPNCTNSLAPDVAASASVDPIRSHRRRRRPARLQIRRQKLRPQRAQQLAVQPARVLKPHFLLRRMHVHIHQLRRHLQPQKTNRLPAREQQPAIRLAQRVLQRPIANRPAVEKQVLHPAGRPAVHRIGDVAAERHAVALAVNLDQIVGQLVAEKRRDPRRECSPPAADRARVRPLCASVK